MRISFYLFVSPGCASLALWVRCDSGWVWTCSRRPWWRRPSSNCTTKYGCKIMADTDILLSEREVSDWANDWTLQELQPLAFADNCQSGNQSYFPFLLRLLPLLFLLSILSLFSFVFLILLSPMQSYVSHILSSFLSLLRNGKRLDMEHTSHFSSLSRHRIIYQTEQINTLFQLVYLVFWFVYFVSLGLR